MVEHRALRHARSCRSSTRSRPRSSGSTCGSSAGASFAYAARTVGEVGVADDDARLRAVEDALDLGRTEAGVDARRDRPQPHRGLVADRVVDRRRHEQRDDVARADTPRSANIAATPSAARSHSREREPAIDLDERGPIGMVERRPSGAAPRRFPGGLTADNVPAACREYRFRPMPSSKEVRARQNRQKERVAAQRAEQQRVRQRRKRHRQRRRRHPDRRRRRAGLRHRRQQRTTTRASRSLRRRQPTSRDTDDDGRRSRR